MSAVFGAVASILFLISPASAAPAQPVSTEASIVAQASDVSELAGPTPAQCAEWKRTNPALYIQYCL